MKSFGLSSFASPIFMLAAFVTINASYAQTVKPFWTEKSSYIEGDNLYVVGIASNTPSVEAGRELAFENGKSEIMNFAQISNLDGLTIKTQMTYEEKENTKYNVYRLMYVEYDGINSLKSKKIEQAKKNYDRHSQKQEQEIIMKKKALNKLSQNKDELARLDATFNAIVRRHQSLSEKAMRYVKVGMISSEVISILGQPRIYNKGITDSYKYGKYWVVFSGRDTVLCLSTAISCVFSPCEDDNAKCGVGENVSYFYKMYE